MMRYRPTILTPGPPDETAAPACRKAETLRGTARYHNALSINVFLDWHSLCFRAETWLHYLYRATAHRHRSTGESEETPCPAACPHVADTVIEAPCAAHRGSSHVCRWARHTAIILFTPFRRVVESSCNLTFYEVRSLSISILESCLWKEEQSCMLYYCDVKWM